MYWFIKSITSVILSVSILFPYLSKQKNDPPILPYISHGQPLEQYFENEPKAILPWDMLIQDDKLYLGCGDYDTNAGPVPVVCYDLLTKRWNNMGFLPDEQLNRFCLIDGEIIIPGTDPRDDWDYGNYYRITKNGTPEIIRNIPYAIHNYDMVKYDGMIFAGLGVNAGDIPIGISSDQGQTFSRGLMYKNRTLVDTYGYTYVRCYDLIKFKGKLYATLFMRSDETKKDLRYELYEYMPDISAFEFKTDLTEVISRSKLSYDRIRAKEEFDGKMFIVADKLYITDNMIDFAVSDVSKDEKNIVCDMYRDGERLYVLSGKTVGTQKYKITVLEYKDGVFSERINFDYTSPPLSFCCSGDTFFIGCGNAANELRTNGTVLEIKSE